MDIDYTDVAEAKSENKSDVSRADFCHIKDGIGVINNYIAH